MMGRGAAYGGSATAPSLATPEAFHVLRIGAEIGRRVRPALDAADHAGAGHDVVHAFRRGRPRWRLQPAVQLTAQRRQLIGRQRLQALQKVSEFALAHGRYSR